MKKLSCRPRAGFVAALLFTAVTLPSCGDDVDFCTNPGGECPPPREFDVDFVVQTPGRFGALQLDIDYRGEDGSFESRDDRVSCRALVDAIVASNSIRARTVKVGLISLGGIHTPAPLIRCAFLAGVEPAPGDFRVEVLDAADVHSRPVDAPPVAVAVAEREPVTP